MRRVTAFILALVGIVMVIGSAALLLLGGPQAAYVSGDVTLDLIGVAALLPSVGAGLVLVLKLPRNVIGWLILVTGVGAALQNLGGRAVIFTHVVLDRPMTLTEVLASVGDAVWIPVVAVGLVALLLLYPDGRLLSPAWRWVLGLSSLAGLLYLLGTVFVRAPLYFLPSVNNPLGLVGGPQIFEIVQTAPIVVLFMVALPLGITALIMRWRKARSLERHQIKWLLWAAALQVLAILGAIAGSVLIEDAAVEGGWTGALSDIASMAFPVAILIAITRYRLYEIDRIVSRTVGYAVLALLLAAVYVGGVLAVQTVLPASGDLGVAASTLVAAALFSPLRRRVQGWVDRRFNRSRYDAERVVEAFSARLRDAVDLDKVTDDLHNVVATTIEPTSTSFWLREEDSQ